MQETSSLDDELALCLLGSASDLDNAVASLAERFAAGGDDGMLLALLRRDGLAATLAAVSRHRHSALGRCCVVLLRQRMATPSGLARILFALGVPRTERRRLVGWE